MLRKHLKLCTLYSSNIDTNEWDNTNSHCQARWRKVRLLGTEYIRLDLKLEHIHKWIHLRWLAQYFFIKKKLFLSGFGVVLRIMHLVLWLQESYHHCFQFSHVSQPTAAARIEHPIARDICYTFSKLFWILGNHCWSKENQYISTNQKWLNQPQTPLDCV